MTRQLAILFFLFLNSYISRAQGVQVIFFKSLEQAHLHAKEQNKGTFIKVCESENRTCQKLDEEVFTDEEISNILNLNYANVRIDPNVESSFARTMEIKRVPTLIFLDKEGEEVDRMVGYKDAAETNKIIISATRKISGMNDQRKNYLANKKDNAILKEYYNNLINAGFASDAGRLVTQFFYNIDEILTQEDRDFIYESADHPRSQSFKYIFEHLTLFDTAYGTVKISDQLMTALINSLNPEFRDDMDYIDRRMKSAFRGQDYQRFMDAYIIANYQSNKLSENPEERDALYFESVMRRLNRMNCTDAEYFNSLSVSLMMKNQDTSFLSNLKDRVTVCFNISRDIATLDLLSVLTYKLGEKDEAIKMVQQATQMAFDQQMKFVSSLPYFKDLGFIE